ncbi:MAG TPA: DUF4173 domain-containing protein [Thermoanaerobaculia bacterium]|jgi:hypothetical protein
MNEQPRVAATAALAALLTGAAADLLLRYIPWGLAVPVWTLLFVAAAFVVARRAGRAISPLPALCALAVSAGLAWRDSEPLGALDRLALVAFLPLLALDARGVRIRRAGLSEIAAAFGFTGLQSAAGLPQLLFHDLSWSEMPRRAPLRAGGIALRGALIALPALLLFGGLLASADAAFAQLLRKLLIVDNLNFLGHLVCTLLFSAIAAGFLRSLAFSGPLPRLPRPSFLRLGAPETNIAVALIDALFALFVFVQFRYLFGGERVVRVPGSTVSWSEYARGGFFQLVTVVALVVPMLLAVEWLIDKSDARALRRFRLLALIQIALVFVIAASAYRRMQLYVDAYGLTEDRFYTTAFMLWVGVLLLWFVGTVLTGKREHFAAGAIATAAVALMALHAINPDARIVETNLARASRRPFDVCYAVSLSADAVPLLAAHANALGSAAAELRKYQRGPAGWRTWNASRAAAARALRGKTLPARSFCPR